MGNGRDVATRNNNQAAARTLEQVLIMGNLAPLSEMERVQYYAAVCDSVGLNPKTQPFIYVELDGKLKLYATKDASDQLRNLHKVSLRIIERETIDDEVHLVTVEASTPDGRFDTSIGVVSLTNKWGKLKGQDYANALMKAETKAKRRATLSICGLGFNDETEIDEEREARPEIAMPRAIDDPIVEVDQPPIPLTNAQARAAGVEPQAPPPPRSVKRTTTQAPRTSPAQPQREPQQQSASRAPGGNGWDWTAFWSEFKRDAGMSEKEIHDVAGVASLKTLSVPQLEDLANRLRLRINGEAPPAVDEDGVIVECCLCNDDATRRFDGQPYCSGHWPNEFLEHANAAGDRL